MDMLEKNIALRNSVFWDPQAEDKVYMTHLKIVIDSLVFATRRVLMRFRFGPSADFSFADMDHIVSEYLQMRGVSLPPLPPSKCQAGDFVVPKTVLPAVEPPVKARRSRKKRNSN